MLNVQLDVFHCFTQNTIIPVFLGLFLSNVTLEVLNCVNQFLSVFFLWFPQLFYIPLNRLACFQSLITSSPYLNSLFHCFCSNHTGSMSCLSSVSFNAAFFIYFSDLSALYSNLTSFLSSASFFILSSVTLNSFIRILCHCEAFTDIKEYVAASP